ncbi:SDR family NAD(P)-dependent oxidoreductase [Aldersonia sp. NBC_00410]|uniref:SDR family NAD(P)-dependent oxidoreductase n=1 Tax=Aldersonia sp. NBC_00410 TaxID=2975954 RepID=UPI00225387B8|nr:SDR family NAD(P)-dependent oxidoreductase [Aldersonia sp. NBC_00410]MCX5045120.1 SDR family NAD(P)-dependent oxidoreductase [Aldersonia sp. NBC_00410]
MTRKSSDLAGRRVLITGAARGIGAALARQLHSRGARVALLGIEPELLGQVAAECGGAPWRYCDVGDRAQVESAVDGLVAELGGLDVLVANAGIAKQIALVGGDPEVFEQTMRVNALGVYYSVHAAGPHLSHPGGYVLLTSSLAAAINLPLLGAYSASKAAVQAFGKTLRQELAHTGAEVGIAYFAELDTDMTTRGFGTEAARYVLGGKPISGPAPLQPAIDALERAITRRERRVVSPSWVGGALLVRDIAQRVVELRLRGAVPGALKLARAENPPFTTEQPVA